MLDPSTATTLERKRGGRWGGGGGGLEKRGRGPTQTNQVSGFLGRQAAQLFLCLASQVAPIHGSDLFQLMLLQAQNEKESYLPRLPDV